MRYRRLLRFAAPLSLCGVVACSLLVDTGGLGDGAPPSTEAGTDDAESSTAADAANRTETSPTDGDAGADGAVAEHAYSLAVRADAPRAYLRLEEQSGAAIAESAVDGGPPGFYAGGITFGVAGAFDGSRGITLAGSNGGVGLGKALPVSGKTPFSLELWFRPDVNDASYRFLASGYELVDGGRESFGVYTHAIAGLVAERYVADNQENTGIPPLGPGVYRHVVLTYDGASMALYVDGTLASSAADARSARSTAPVITFGAFGNNNASVRGSIDELAVYDKALTAARVLAHYKASGR